MSLRLRNSEEKSPGTEVNEIPSVKEFAMEVVLREDNSDNKAKESVTIILGGKERGIDYFKKKKERGIDTIED